MKKLLLLSFFSLFFMVSAYAQTEKVKPEVKSKALTVNIYYTGTNGSARAFVNEMKSSGTVDAIRSEAGNLRYEYFFPEDNSETVLLIDSWESQEAIDKPYAASWFGFGITYWNPVDEVEFLQKYHPGLKNIINDYDSGGYLIWKLYPQTKVLIDPRSFP